MGAGGKKNADVCLSQRSADVIIQWAEGVHDCERQLRRWTSLLHRLCA